MDFEIGDVVTITNPQSDAHHKGFRFNVIGVVTEDDREALEKGHKVGYVKIQRDGESWYNAVHPSDLAKAPLYGMGGVF